MLEMYKNNSPVFSLKNPLAQMLEKFYWDSFFISSIRRKQENELTQMVQQFTVPNNFSGGGTRYSTGFFRIQSIFANRYIHRGAL